VVDRDDLVKGYELSNGHYIPAAVLAAFDSAFKEAAARGFQWIHPLAAFLSAARVGIQVLATTEPLNDADEAPRPGVQLPASKAYEL
jgi:hypothetical protein